MRFFRPTCLVFVCFLAGLGCDSSKDKKEPLGSILCGNGALDENETCDDGNTTAETACTYGNATCTTCTRPSCTCWELTTSGSLTSTRAVITG